jgi:hypothetical protein
MASASLVVSMDHLSVRNHRESTIPSRGRCWHRTGGAGGGDAPIESVLSGVVQAAAVDGPSWQSPPRGPELDLGADEPPQLRRGRLRPCERQAVSADRPWGADNPYWRLFLYGPLPTFAPYRFAGPVYVLVWVADDGREVDGNPEQDGMAETPGHGVLRVRADAFGRSGARRAIEAELVRVCRPDAASTRCLSGIRVQSWRDVRQAVP